MKSAAALTAQNFSRGLSNRTPAFTTSTLLRLPGAARARASSRSAFRLAHCGCRVAELRPRERDYEKRVTARPVEQVLEELEQLRVRPLHVLEHEDDEIVLCESFEEVAASPRRGPMLVPASPPSSASSCASLGSIHVSLVRRRRRSARAWPELRPGEISASSPSAISARIPHHLCQRPERYALSVRESPSLDASESFAPTPSSYFWNSQARRYFPMPAMPTIETRCALCSLRARMEELLQRDGARRSRPTNGGSSVSDLRPPPRPAVDSSACHTVTGSPCPFNSWRPASLTDRGLRRPARRLSDEHGPELRQRLYPLRGVY